MLLKNETYDLLKFLALDVIPAIAVLVGTVGEALGWNYTAIAVTIIAAIGKAIAMVIGESSKAYYTQEEE